MTLFYSIPNGDIYVHTEVTILVKEGTVHTEERLLATIDIRQGSQGEYIETRPGRDIIDLVRLVTLCES